MAKTVIKPAVKTAAKPVAKREGRRPSFFRRVLRYFRDVRSELKKVTWPSKENVIKYTGVVLAFIALFAVVVGLMDYGLVSLMEWIVR